MNQMTRQEKIEFLKAVAKGERSLDELLPPLKVLLTYTVGDIRLGIEGQELKPVLVENFVSEIRAIKQANPGKRIVVEYADNEELYVSDEDIPCLDAYDAAMAEAGKFADVPNEDSLIGLGAERAELKNKTVGMMPTEVKEDDDE